MNGVRDIGGDAIGAAIEILQQIREGSGQPEDCEVAQFFTPGLIQAPQATDARFPLNASRVYYIGDDSSLCPPSNASLENADAIVVVLDGAKYPPDALLTKQLDPLRGVANAFFAAVKARHQDVENGDVRVGSVVYNAWHGGVLNPITGLLGGIVKSLHREFPKGYVAAVASDATLEESLNSLELELAQRYDSGMLPEIFVCGGRRMQEALQPNPSPHSASGRDLFGPHTVVLATGGARGVTAILIEDILKRYGGKVIAVGRTNLQDVPERLLSMSESDMRDYESTYYREQIASGARVPMPVLKKQFERISSANEIHRTTESFAQLPGSFEYLCADITDSVAVDAVIDDIYARYGRIDLVIHGAGIQSSRRISKKSVEEFDAIVSAKIVGLQRIFSAISRHADARAVDVHVLTSSFSFWGNDGQPDYGAANESLNRLAAAMNAGSSLPGNWSSLAWLGWPTIGMARDFAWLGTQRTLHPITKEEGQMLFHHLTQRKPAQSVNVLATEKEIGYFGVPVVSRPVRARAISRKIDLSASAAPYLADHVVDGIPTMPGAVEFFLAWSTASELCPDLRVDSLWNCRFNSFLRAYPDRPSNARLHAQVLREDEAGATVRVQVCSDFIHNSGRVLRADVQHFSADVTCSRMPRTAPGNEVLAATQAGGASFTDPYVGKTSAMQLKGMFDCVREIYASESGQRATIALDRALSSHDLRDTLIPVLALDSLARVSTMSPCGSSLAVYVPIFAERLRFYRELRAKDIFGIFNYAVVTGMKPVILDNGDARTQRTAMFSAQGDLIVEALNTIARPHDSVALDSLLLSTQN